STKLQGQRVKMISIKEKNDNILLDTLLKYIIPFFNNKKLKEKKQSKLEELVKKEKTTIKPLELIFLEELMNSFLKIDSNEILNNFNDKLKQEIENEILEHPNNHVEVVNRITVQKQAERYENSYIGRIGKFIEPAIRPLGFDWKIGVSLLTGIVVKEIVVSTMGILYQAEAMAETNENSIAKSMQNQTYTSGEMVGKKVYSPLVAFGLMVFVLVYFPCVSVIAAIRKESEEVKWAIFTVLYSTSLAWFLSFSIYQIGSYIST
ncbi:MAG: hypothetical protein IH948_05895, partial [Bacteroidetes bacterium]|nr:hypothetical protein [Bacteroidota bacterium]